jgi:hypothetical protein
MLDHLGRLKGELASFTTRHDTTSNEKGIYVWNGDVRGERYRGRGRYGRGGRYETRQRYEARREERASMDVRM